MKSLKPTFLAVLALAAQLIDAAVFTRAAGPALPENDAFYIPPSGFETTAPGTILRNRPVPNTMSGFNISAAYQVLYRTTDSFDRAIVAVSTILVPNKADKSKLVSYQIAEDAANPDCCPSYVFQDGSQTGGLLGTVSTKSEMKLIQQALDKGWYVTVPDFLGPKSAFLANNLAGYAVLDGVRAALASSSFTQLGSNPATALWGYSGGSLASGFAAELQPCYAPELKIAGAALGGTCPSISSVLYTINKSTYAGLIVTGILGLSNEYAAVASTISSGLVSSKADQFNQGRELCLGAAVIKYSKQDIFTYFKDPSIFNSTAMLRVIAENNMGQAAPSIPLMIYKGSKDEISPVADTDSLVQKYCSQGTSVEYHKVAGATHLGLLTSGTSIAMKWLEDRLNGVASSTGCSTGN